MKQLKVIVNQYNTVNNSGFIDINFNQSIEIPPYSSLALDKISMEILPSPTGRITIAEDQEILITTQSQGNVSGTRSCILKAGQYTYNTSSLTPNQNSGIPDLLLTLNSICNGILNGTPKLPSANTDPAVDYGLGFKWTGAISGTSYKVTLNAYQCNFGTANQAQAPVLNNADITQNNMTAIASANNGFSAKTTNTSYYAYTKQTLINGCLQANIDLRANDITDPDATFSYGLALPPASGGVPVVLYGIKGVGGKMYIINNGVQGSEINKTPFLPSSPVTQVVNVYMYTDETSNHLHLCVQQGNDPIIISSITPDGAYTGFNYNTAYCLAVTGYAKGTTFNTCNSFQNWSAFFQPFVVTDNIGNYFQIPENRNYLSAPNLNAVTPIRILQLDFTNSPLLINNLGFATNILQGTCSVANMLSIPAANGVDFVNWYDLALDVLNLNLETYVGNSGSSSASGKRNTLCYFLIQRLTPEENIFFAEAKQLVFLDIANRETISVSTLQFRIYNVSTNIPLNFTNGSFNIYITDKADRIVNKHLY
jgi:hypothetical protein